MKIKNILCIVFLLLVTGLVTLRADADSIFNHKITAKEAAKNLPEFSDISCKFAQEKSVKNSTTSTVTLKSGGNFKFDVKSGVIFDTLYPVKSTTAYTTEQSKRVSDIIVAISRKDYSYINKNFDVFYVKNPNSWQVALKPKKSSKISNVMNSIVIDGSTYINRLEINTLKSGSTKINFTECK